MSPCSILIISAGLLAAGGGPGGAAKAHVTSAPSHGCVLVTQSESLASGEITRLGFDTQHTQFRVQQTGYSQACAAPVCCAPSSCTPVSCAATAQCDCAGYQSARCAGAYCNQCPCCEKQGCCDRCRNRCAWHRAHTTGDMFPHYAYYPQHHGYYYFRPYNWMHVLEHQARVIGMGGDSRNPYSVAMFDAVYEDFEQRFPQMIDTPPGSVQPLGSSLPNLEDVLNNRY